MKVLVNSQNKAYITSQGKALKSNKQEEVQEKDICFYDYDGTLVESWTLEELQTKTELPPNPTHEGLTAQGWNWSLADIKTHNEILDVGQLYEPSDGNTHLVIKITESEINFPFRIGYFVNGNADVDWGDGSTHSTITGAGFYTASYSDYHSYSEVGEYTITLSHSGNTRIGGGILLNSVNGFAKLLLIKAFLSNKVTSIYTNAFNGYRNLECIITSSQFIDMYSFQLCWSLKILICSKQWGSTSIHSSCGIRVISLAKTNNIFRNSEVLRTALNLRRFVTVSTVQEAQGGYFFYNCYNLKKVVITSNITALGNRAFENCPVLSEVWFKNEIPPTASSSVTFVSLPTFFKAIIPYDSTDYLTATNYPSPTTYKYIGVETFASGEALPTAPTDTSYTLTWYENISDAEFQNNPITVGNGKRVFCRYTEVTE